MVEGSTSLTVRPSDSQASSENAKNTLQLLQLTDTRPLSLAAQDIHKVLNSLLL